MSKQELEKLRKQTALYNKAADVAFGLTLIVLGLSFLVLGWRLL